MRDIPRLVLRNGVFNAVWTEPAIKGPDGQTIHPARSKRFGLRTRDPDEAKDRYAAFLTQGASVFKGDLGAAGVTVARALDDYWREHASTVAAPLRQEKAIYHLKQFFGGIPLGEVDIPKCRSYADARRAGVIGGGVTRRGDGVGADSTIRRELGVLSAAAHHAARWRRIGPSAVPPSPMPVFELPKESVNSYETMWIDKRGVETLIAASDGRLYHFIKLAYWWAARRGWVERLHVSQVDLKNGRVNPYRPDERRTSKRRMIMPIFPKIRGNVEELMRDVGSDGYLFGGPNVSMYRPFRRLCELCGYEDRAHPHVLRHSRATHLLQDGISIYAVAKLLGDTVKTVERVYGHFSQEYLMEIEER